MNPVRAQAFYKQRCEAVVTPNRPLLECAFELARTGRYRSIPEIRRALKADGFPQSNIDAHFRTQTLKDDLRRCWEDAGAPDGARADRHPAP